MGLPGLAGADHIGITVPDLEAATRFFVDVIGCKVTFEVGPFASDDDWMQQHLGVDPRSKINKLRMLKCANGPSIELFEYDVKDQKNAVPKNSDVGGHHVGFYVTDLDAAVAHLRRNGVKVLGEPTLMNEGPSAGLRWLPNGEADQIDRQGHLRRAGCHGEVVRHRREHRNKDVHGEGAAAGNCRQQNAVRAAR